MEETDTLFDDLYGFYMSEQEDENYFLGSIVCFYLGAVMMTRAKMEEISDEGYIADLYSSSIPMIAVSDVLPTSEDTDCLEHGYFDLIALAAPQALVRKRIDNAIRVISNTEKLYQEAMEKTWL